MIKPKKKHESKEQHLKISTIICTTICTQPSQETVGKELVNASKQTKN